MTTADAGVLPVSGLSTATERPGTVIGWYTLIEVIGSGGFGSVFLAEQSEPVSAPRRAQGPQAGDGHRRR